MCKQVTTEAFIEKAIKIHGNRYNYSKAIYINAKSKITIICSIHGEFSQLPNNHFKYNCRKCGDIASGINGSLKIEKFIERAKVTHKEKYDYTKTNYLNSKTRVIITCPIHGDFKQTPSDHLQGKGCSKCKNEKLSINPWSYTDWENRGNTSINFDSFKVYIIKCWNDTEIFYKIGKTYVSIAKRFKYKKEMPYKWKIIKVYEGSAIDMSKLEYNLHNLNNKYSYVPNISFGGKYECFSYFTSLDSF